MRDKGITFQSPRGARWKRESRCLGVSNSANIPAVMPEELLRERKVELHTCKAFHLLVEPALDQTGEQNGKLRPAPGQWSFMQ